MCVANKKTPYNVLRKRRRENHDLLSWINSCSYVKSNLFQSLDCEKYREYETACNEEVNMNIVLSC